MMHEVEVTKANRKISERTAEKIADVLHNICNTAIGIIDSTEREKKQGLTGDIIRIVTIMNDNNVGW